MLFTEFIRQSREQLQLPQRKLAEALDIDTATYCKIEKGERKVKKEQVVVIAQVLNIEEKELLSLWLADQVSAIVADEKSIAEKVLNIAKDNINRE
ncbi:helix-turn-helix transcriptional regulator [Parabacteroides sp. PF5-6]|uniref:helix-turn-helix domain-containing protein n=1 Tax=Parabacteroides sp. PF5-6 TaxID=1742403 RepID=UPI0024053933|nr:helix-turn-helix transcriptional regulator [Parabacteroides sp. PF5-6]